MHVSPRIEILHSEYRPKAHSGRRDTHALTTAQKQRLVGARPVRAVELWTKYQVSIVVRRNYLHFANTPASGSHTLAWVSPAQLCLREAPWWPVRGPSSLSPCRCASCLQRAATCIKGADGRLLCVYTCTHLRVSNNVKREQNVGIHSFTSQGSWRTLRVEPAAAGASGQLAKQPRAQPGGERPLPSWLVLLSGSGIWMVLHFLNELQATESNLGLTLSLRMGQ